MGKKKQNKKTWMPATNDKRLFTLDVFIFSGPMTKKFLRKNKAISRTIQILGYQTLKVLHEAIFDAFDREEEHMYEFQIGGKGPYDKNAKQYIQPVDDDFLFPNEQKAAGFVTETTIGSLGLKVDDNFGYLFDFGDDWWHQVRVLSIDDRVPVDKYPKVTKRIGASPPQYPNLDEEE